MLGKTEDQRRRGQQRMRWLDGILDSMDMSLKDREAWHAVVHGGPKESDTKTITIVFTTWVAVRFKFGDIRRMPKIVPDTM